MKNKYTVDNVYQIWDNSNGTRIEVGLDRDGLDFGLDLIEVRAMDGMGNVEACVFFADDRQAKLVAIAINKLIEEKLRNKEELPDVHNIHKV